MSEYTTYINDTIGKLPYCPGCSHQMVIKALDKALVKLQVDPTKVVIVTDIGCIGLSDRYFNTSAFHGLHGRSITYASGLKLARPELTVITLMGDGGAGIGGTHLLNVARRNIGIKLIVANNFNYGMTGGQHSVTTPSDGRTSTTPWGNVEGPMNLCGTVIAAGGAWVYRATAFDKDLADTMATAIQQEGFAMLDIWELCTAYYSPRNQLKKKELMALIDSYGFDLGLLADNPRPEYSVRYKDAYEKGKTASKDRKYIETKHGHNVEKQTGIIIAGSAGQKIKSSASLLARAAMFAGLDATQKDDYPITVMTGHSVAEIIVSPEKIEYTSIDAPDYFIAVSEDGVRRTTPKIKKLPETCTLIAEESLELPETKAKVVRLPIVDTGKKTSKLSLAIIAMGAMLKETGLFPVEALADAIKLFQKKKIADINTNALSAGADLVG